MADLQCAIRNPGCKGTAKFICHHCGKPICIHCDKEMIDEQFAPRFWFKPSPRAHHCPKCYHRSANGKPILRGVKSTIGKYLRKFSF